MICVYFRLSKYKQIGYKVDHKQGRFIILYLWIHQDVMIKYLINIPFFRNMFEVN